MRFKPVKIVWKDACTHREQVPIWEAEELAKEKPVLREEVGWLIGEGEECVVVARTIDDHHGRKVIGEHTRIPRALVVEIVELAEKRLLEEEGEGR